MPEQIIRSVLNIEPSLILFFVLVFDLNQNSIHQKPNQSILLVQTFIHLVHLLSQPFHLAVLLFIINPVIIHVFLIPYKMQVHFLRFVKILQKQHLFINIDHLFNSPINVHELLYLVIPVYRLCYQRNQKFSQNKFEKYPATENNSIPDKSIISFRHHLLILFDSIEIFIEGDIKSIHNIDHIYSSLYFAKLHIDYRYLYQHNNNYHENRDHFFKHEDNHVVIFGSLTILLHYCHVSVGHHYCDCYHIQLSIYICNIIWFVRHFQFHTRRLNFQIVQVICITEK